MTGTTETRTAAMVLRDKLIEMREEKRGILIRINHDHEVEKKPEKWIVTSWCMEVQLMTNAIDDLEKQIIDNEFDF